MERYSKVGSGLVKDNKTHAILNTDSEKVKQAKLIKKARRNQNKEIDDLKRDVNDIKSMLSQIVEKLNGA
tara:strand:+ start:2335 stop:2544 length:210 start_codon:yes stop_codon:yes gene_type:complete